ncbi:MAG: hypothetical protein KAJ98_04685 [Spirochaetaceae bacterium]|nr:hypothetical protein [Spirochaetaceae bacterium]
MNQDQVREMLLSLEKDVPEFSIIFTGKESKRVDGLYKPERHEILIHNRNFSDENTLIYTAIHEFAHHVHFSRFPDEVTRRAHTNRFWDFFHRLLSVAEERGIYRNLFDNDQEFIALTKRIRGDYLEKNGNLMKEFGKLLVEALNLCREKHAVFEDYAERVLGMPRGSAHSLMKVYTLDVDETLGFEKMKVVAAIRDPKARTEAVDSFREGKTPSQVRQHIKESRTGTEPTQGRLEAQKRRLEKSISNLKEKLDNVERQLQIINLEAGL